MLALMPSMGIGTLARRYAVNFMIFGAWGLIYGVFCRLAIALNINSMAAITGAGTFGGMLAGATSEVLLAAASILFSVCILLIPFLAKRIVEGDLGATMFTVLGASRGTRTVRSRLRRRDQRGAIGQASSASGVGEGGGGSAAAASSGAPPDGQLQHPPGVALARSQLQGPAGSAGGGQAPQRPAPSGGGHGIGHYRPVNIPHAVGWLAGAAAAVGVRGGQRAVVASRNLGHEGGECCGRGDSEPT